MRSPTYTLPHLKAALDGVDGVTILEDDDAALIFSRRGARLLGLFPDTRRPNVLWLHKDLATQIRSESWLTGGERLWAAPERNFYYADPERFERFRVQPGIDPDNYREEAPLAYSSTFDLEDSLLDTTYHGAATRRTFCRIDDPYKTNHHFAGVAIQDSLSLPDLPSPCSAWTITQVVTAGPTEAGVALFPVTGGSHPLHYFGAIPPDRIGVDVTFIHYRIDGHAVSKLAIRPEDLVWSNPVRAVYLSPHLDGERWIVVAKRSSDLPRGQADSVDPAKGNPDGPRGVVQSYNSGAEDSLYFGELELQLSSSRPPEVSRSTGRHELLAYCGDKPSMIALAAMMVGVAPERVAAVIPPRG